MTKTFQVELRWVPLSDSENAERCQRLRELFLRAARRLASPAKGLNAAAEVIPQSHFPGVLPSMSGESINNGGK